MCQKNTICSVKYLKKTKIYKNYKKSDKMLKLCKKNTVTASVFISFIIIFIILVLAEFVPNG